MGTRVQDELKAKIDADKAFLAKQDKAALEKKRADLCKTRDEIAAERSTAEGKAKGLRGKRLAGPLQPAEEKELAKYVAAMADGQADVDLCNENIATVDHALNEIAAAQGRIAANEQAIKDADAADLATARKAALAAEIKTHTDVVAKHEATMAQLRAEVDRCVAALAIALHKAGMTCTEKGVDVYTALVKGAENALEWSRRAEPHVDAALLAAPIADPHAVNKAGACSTFAKRMAALLQEKAAAIEAHLVTGMPVRQAIALECPEYIKFMHKKTALIQRVGSDPHAALRDVLQVEADDYNKAHGVGSMEAHKAVRDQLEEVVILAAQGRTDAVPAK